MNGCFHSFLDFVCVCVWHKPRKRHMTVGWTALITTYIFPRTELLKTTARKIAAFLFFFFFAALFWCQVSVYGAVYLSACYRCQVSVYGAVYLSPISMLSMPSFCVWCRLPISMLFLGEEFKEKWTVLTNKSQLNWTDCKCNNRAPPAS